MSFAGTIKEVLGPPDEDGYQWIMFENDTESRKRNYPYIEVSPSGFWFNGRETVFYPKMIVKCFDENSVLYLDINGGWVDSVSTAKPFSDELTDDEVLDYLFKARGGDV